MSAFHIQAAIAAGHAVSPDFASTDWPTILRYYDRLREIWPTPVVALNRAVALAMVDGPAAGSRTIEASADDPALDRYALLPITLGELYRRAGDDSRAAAWLRRALERPCSPAEERFARGRLAALHCRAAAGRAAAVHDPASALGPPTPPTRPYSRPRAGSHSYGIRVAGQ